MAKFRGFHGLTPHLATAYLADIAYFTLFFPDMLVDRLPCE